MCCSAALFVQVSRMAVASSGTANRVMTSPNGSTWTTRNTTGLDYEWSSVTFANDLFVAAATSGHIMTSYDGITWTSRTTAATNSWRRVAYGNGVFVAVAGTGARFPLIETEQCQYRTLVVEIRCFSIWLVAGTGYHTKSAPSYLSPKCTGCTSNDRHSFLCCAMGVCAAPNPGRVHRVP